MSRRSMGPEKEHDGAGLMARLFGHVTGRLCLARQSCVEETGSTLLYLLLACALIIAATFASGHPAAAASPETSALLPSLRSIAVPGLRSEELAGMVKDKKAAIQLGKALFWETRVGSDNKTACASCHFHAGADSRVTNQINPGLLGGDNRFDLGGPNYTLKASDFPLTRFADINDAASMVSDRNDVVSSQGVYTTKFANSAVLGAPDVCEAVSDAVAHGGSGFNLGGINTRRTEPRNAPTVFNAAFNFRNFWDGRGNNVFNGGDPFGWRSDELYVWKLEAGVLRKVPVSLQQASLASLASGPPLSENEMSCKTRNFTRLGSKLLDLQPLANQAVAADDSVLGASAPPYPSYRVLIQRAFEPAYWSSTAAVGEAMPDPQPGPTMDLPLSRHPRFSGGPPRPGQTGQMEANFSLYFGVALQLYMETLVAGDTPYDRYAEGRTDALDARQLRGLALFTGKAQCIHCHVGPAMTSASTFIVSSDVRLDERDGENGTVFRYDNGFFNTGVRPTRDDPGVGGFDPYGYPLSETRMTQIGKAALLGGGFNEPGVDPMALTAIDGAFKTPGLRNVEFTGPYFHNGGKATLMQVVDFYNRGGDFGAKNRPLSDPSIRPLGLTEDEKRDLVAFLLALSDDRVRFEKAPFDHPAICVPHGQVGNSSAIRADPAGNAIDVMECIPAVGAAGAKTALSTFLKLDPYQH
jgi:cytochrome c peroxidase